MQPEPGAPPDKWTVYEKILRVPYYIVFDRYTDDFRAFKLNAGSYEPLSLPDGRLWLPELQVGLGVWQGNYKQVERLWLRWYNETGSWLPTPAERAETAESELANLKSLLQAKGIDPTQL